MENDDYNNSGQMDDDDEEIQNEMSGYDDPEEQEESEQRASEQDEEDEEGNQLGEDDEDSIYDDEPDKTLNVIEESELNEITSPYMTKYQKARIIGVRAVQISKNAPIYVEIGDNMNNDALSIAEKELAQKKIPFIIRRYLPNGSFQHWKVSQLKTFD